MLSKIKKSTLLWVGLLLGSFGLLAGTTSCGKQTSASPQGLNIQYEVLNLSPDLGLFNLYINFVQVNKNTNPFRFATNTGYFYLPANVLPFQFRPYLATGTSGTVLFQRNDVLKPGIKYSLFITGSFAKGDSAIIFTADTAAAPALGRGKVRFINASPTGIGGLDVSANGTPLFKGINYPKISSYMELPVGNYDFQITPTGNNTTVLKDQPNITIQDGKLYTIYAYGYTTRPDTAAFNAGIITNK